MALQTLLRVYSENVLFSPFVGILFGKVHFGMSRGGNYQEIHISNKLLVGMCNLSEGLICMAHVFQSSFLAQEKCLPGYRVNNYILSSQLYFIAVCAPLSCHNGSFRRLVIESRRQLQQFSRPRLYYVTHHVKIHLILQGTSIFCHLALVTLAHTYCSRIMFLCARIMFFVFAFLVKRRNSTPDLVTVIFHRLT